MSVASSSLVNPPRTKALMIRLAPYLVEAVCELTRALKDKTHSQTEISGLLFGKSQDGMLTIEALKTFKDSSGPRSDLARRERMEKAFTAAMTLANEDPEFSAYKLLGWFSLRGGGGLINSDVEFHNQHFKNNEDIALIVWREGDTQLTTELYAAIENGKLTAEDYRWSSVRLSTELRHVSQPVDLVMRIRMNDDLYLRTYGVPDGRERKEEWKKIAENAKRAILSFLPGRGRSEAIVPEDLPVPPPERPAKRAFETRTLFRGSDSEVKAELPSSAPAKPVPSGPSKPAPSAPSKPAPSAPPKPPASAPPKQKPTPPTPVPEVSAARSAPQRAEAPPAPAPYDVNRAPRPNQTPEISGLPMVIPKHKPAKGAPWLSMALVFVLCSGLTFVVLALKNAGSSDGKLNQIMRVLFPGSELELHAESRGESLVLSWNRRNPVVAASSGAVLTITDGRKHFERSLDPDLVAEGVVSYRPVTGDVTFQLRVTGADQTIAFGKLRVLDANSPASSDAGKPVLDLNKPTTAESSAANSTTTTQSPASQPGSVTPQLTVAASTEPPHTPSAQTNNTGVKLPAANPPLTGTVKRPVETYKQAQTAKQVPNQPSQQEKLAQSASQQPTSTTPVPVISAPKPVASHSNTNSTPSTISPQTSNTAINGWDPNLPENKPAAQQSQQQTGPPDSKTIDFIGPKVLLQVMPNPRSLTPGLVSEVTRVEVELRIDTTGHVKAAHLTNPNVKSQLGAASIAAAKQWTFQPASLRGQHVESDHTIVFEFRPEGL